ncbi:MAG: nuclear transport factor 2 family protein [Acidobacteriota bacterium]
MKRMLMLVLSVLVTQVPAFSQSKTNDLTQSSSPEDQVRSAESALFRAYAAHDTAVLERLLSDDLSFTKENGYVSSKATELRLQKDLQQKRGSQSSTSLNPDEDLGYQLRDIRLYGNTAVTIGSSEEHDSNGEAVHFHFTNTWVKHGKSWQVVAIQITTVTNAVLRKMANP